MASDWVADPDEQLDNGWERDLPSSDSLLRAYTDAFLRGNSVAHLGCSMSHVEYVSASPRMRGRGYGER